MDSFSAGNESSTCEGSHQEKVACENFEKRYSIVNSPTFIKKPLKAKGSMDLPLSSFDLLSNLMVEFVENLDKNFLNPSKGIESLLKILLIVILRL